MKKIIIFTLTMLVVAFLLTGCEKIVKETNDKVTATVTNKHRRAGYHSRVGKVMVWHSAKYKVTLTYDGVETTLNNHELYDKVEVGDKLEVNLYRGYNEEGEEVVAYLDLINEEEK